MLSDLARAPTFKGGVPPSVPCPVSHVTCRMSSVRCQVSGVRCQVSLFTCHKISFTCHVSCVRCEVYLFLLKHKHQKKINFKRWWKIHQRKNKWNKVVGQVIGGSVTVLATRSSCQTQEGPADRRLFNFCIHVCPFVSKLLSFILLCQYTSDLQYFYRF